MTKHNLTKDDIKHIAKLSNLSLSEQELTTITHDLSETITYIENLDELKTDSVNETFQTDEVNIYFEDGAQNKRQLSTKEALSNSKKADDSYFIVEKIM